MKNQKLGAMSLFTAAAFYGLYGVFSRLIGSAFGNFSQDGVRNIIVVLLIFLVILARGKRLKPIRHKDAKWIILWFLSGSWATVFSFIAFNNLKIGTSYLIIYSSMIMAGFISGNLFFKEKLNAQKLTALTLCLVGLIIIYSFSIKANEVVYVLLAFTSGFMTGIWNTISKKFSKNYSNNQLVLMDAGARVVAVLFGMFIFSESLQFNIEPIRWFWVAVYAVAQTLNVGLVVYGFKNLEAQIGSIILPVEVVFATLFSYLIFNEIPQVTSFLGGAFILLGALLLNMNVFESKKIRV